MPSLDIACRRLLNQHIAQTTFEKPGDVVAWLGAVQAQDYLGALWAVGLRTRHAAEADIEQAIADKTIVRTWLMRGTLHFVAPADARWMLKLLTPRVVAATARRHLQQYDLDDATIAHCREVILDALQGGKQMARSAMHEVLGAAHIPTANQRGLHILWRLAQEGVICFGARKGKQQTFALLDEWAPAAKTMERDEALAELAQRYFTSHGPATLQDLVWWSGLTTADARAGLEMAKPHLANETVDGKTYWRSQTMPVVKDVPPTAYLLPNYDEYLVGYKDRSAVYDPAHAKLATSSTGIFTSAMVLNGQVVGIWKRAFKNGSVVITLSPFAALAKAEYQAFVEAAKRYGAFLDLPAVLA
jgi:hypothetical protein